MSLHRDERGLTTLELVLATLVLATVAVAAHNAAVTMLRWVTVGSAAVSESANVGRAVQVLSEDLRQPARSGISIGGLEFNSANMASLTWTDRTTAPTTSYAVSYSISGGHLVRTLTRTQGATLTTTTLTVARDLDPAGASGGAQFTRTAGAPGVVRVLLTLKQGEAQHVYELTVEQRP